MHKILIVEDSNLVRLKLTKTLEKNGFTNNVGVNSADFVIDKPYLYLKDVKLIIMDIALPGISGIEAAYWLKTNSDYANIPIIFLSSSSDSATVKNALKAGGVDYIVKPFAENVLITRINKILINSHHPSTISAIDRNEAQRIISIEYSRSIRGNQPVSFIVMKSHQSDIKQKINTIPQMLRQIDQTYLCKNQEVLIVLPLTDDYGAKIVAKKIEDWLDREKIIFVELKIYTITTEPKLTLEELLEEILGYDKNKY